MNVCLFCSNPLIGRADKKYCDVQCKNGFHNAQLKKQPAQELLILQRILNNRIQIKLLLGVERRKEVTYEKLKSVGVDIDFSRISEIRMGRNNRVALSLPFH